jgi:hypothetical protein
MCFERTDRAISIGRSPLCGGSLIICYMVFLTLMHPLEVITSFWYPNIIWGKKLLYSHFFPYLPRGEKWLYSHFPGGNLLYSHFSTYPAKGDIWLYSHFSGGKGYGGWGGKWLYNTGTQNIIELWTDQNQTGDSTLVQSKGTKTICINSIRIIST